MTRPDDDSIEQVLRRFIAEELLDEEEAHGAQDPLEAGAVDSLGYEQLAAYIEEELGVKLSDAEMVEETFESVPALAAFVESKRGSAKG
jgi:acyl carrier protein